MMGTASSGMEMIFQTFELLVCLDDLLHFVRNDIEQLESQPPFYRLARFMKIQTPAMTAVYPKTSKQPPQKHPQPSSSSAE